MNQSERPAAALDGKSLAIGVLSVTAAVLLVGLLVITALPQPAFGTGQTDRGGDYVMLTQQVSNSNETVIVIDAATSRMSMYMLDFSQKQLKLLQRNVPLDRLPGAANQPPQQPHGGRNP